jgi:hypothetical protein
LVVIAPVIGGSLLVFGSCGTLVAVALLVTG